MCTVKNVLLNIVFFIINKTALLHTQMNFKDFDDDDELVVSKTSIETKCQFVE
jgi:hypothetical protein